MEREVLSLRSVTTFPIGHISVAHRTTHVTCRSAGVAHFRNYINNRRLVSWPWFQIMTRIVWESFDSCASSTSFIGDVQLRYARNRNTSQWSFYPCGLSGNRFRRPHVDPPLNGCPAGRNSGLAHKMCLSDNRDRWRVTRWRRCRPGRISRIRQGDFATSTRNAL
ncbi:hypothetical protein OG21DRAFT_961164 [Imleria badia]|nr:hypothetical protein OG21DRAFT_961164 [Imleria badia]